ncbi:hypothetical protein S7711_06704 [Stachybotrys chartarum IBT 7711]|uniref:non-specific serine/threonine protein kinase n=1 Tax=Stachybotrys chartarum (strain CBS 109288 / IBT 7711) TaxID=1280523 RepID=A0A084APK8_STACB|nr:hypothetical protein S7711_06704 [Stachybotrys chartarum IBT 7711]KFA47332.1 hypothetical protein S40293_06054 [Stachybotrys chartarum IBT 40293]KFA75158.1 hypothetical protein S40288_02826 [Stachybotrys chartarum IBT 40288]
MASRQDTAAYGSKKSGGKTIGQFIIDKEIGKGSFAQVYLGWQKESKAAVAIKSVEVERLNKKLKENLYGEIQILKTLRHPHIVALHDCLESSTHINLIMEYCELGDLSLFIKKRDKLITHPATHDMARKYPSTPNSGLHEVVIRHFLKQLSSALEFLRSKNYVHRDVKPQNLLLLPSQAFRDQRSLPIMEASQDSLIPVAGLASLPMLKLADFGFARVLPSTSLADTLCGSPLYMAPEILRYERYDAKADLWSVGTVLYEMITGRPPFRARNHVELLRKIESAEDVIKFPREVSISSDMKHLVRALLKRSPVERLSFEGFFTHVVATSDIPGLVEDDVPKPPKRELRTIPQGEALPPSPRMEQLRQPASESPRAPVVSRSPRDVSPRSPQTGSPGDVRHQPQGSDTSRVTSLPREPGDGLGIQRPVPHHAVSAPNHRRLSSRVSQDQVPLATTEAGDARRVAASGRQLTEEEKAAQDVMFERDYVVVERRQVEVNALADELAANEKLAAQSPTSPRSGQLTRRYTQQGAPGSLTGAVPTPSSRTALVAQGRTAGQDRRGSHEKALSGSPGSTSSMISKAIQDASVRLFGFKVAPLRAVKGQSPPMYQPFPTYPAPSTSAGLIGDGQSSECVDEDVRAAHSIEEHATRSDCVYGFAEVKYKQLVPMAPSTDQGLGGLSVDQIENSDEGLTIDAIVSLSEEALVLYVKSLTLLAKAMDIASLWWAKRNRAEAATGVSAAISQTVVQRINAVVQWVRQRFNEVLEKSEVVRLKLVEAQRLLPEDHPSHPTNQEHDAIGLSTGSGTDQVWLTPGISAGKLMYDRALEMSRAAAIDEVTNDNLPGCEISYITAIRMLEAVLDNDDDSPSKRLGSGKEVAKEDGQDGEFDSDEEAHVRKMIKMITSRLGVVRKKLQMIAEANSKALYDEKQAARAAPAQQQGSRRRSGDTTPRSVASNEVSWR